MRKKVGILKSIHAAVDAGNAILEVYHSDFTVTKKADQSPLTLADMRSHEIIVNALSTFGLPILSEEGKDIPYAEREKWQTYWLIDPLDGTKEFIKRNGEFTVNIALIDEGKPFCGVVYVPDKSTLYFASKEMGAYKANLSQIAAWLNRQITSDRKFDLAERRATEFINDLMDCGTKLPIKDPSHRPFTIVGSRSHSTPELEAFVEHKRRQHGEVEFISAGSSLKLCLVAEGKADIYPRTGPTMEWDTAAGQAIVENAGGNVFQFDSSKPLAYNKENLLNPWFVVLR
jgi:3'(2'), 5'-bisphosphate nucleotidase